MRNSIIDTEFYHLRIDHDQFYFFRFRLIQNTDDQCIDTYGFTGTCGSCDQKVRHFRNICHHCFTCNIFSHSKRKLRFRLLEFFRLEQIPKHNCTVFLIRNFDSHSSLTRDRCLDPDIRSSQIQFDIISQAYDLADLHSHFRLKLITGNRRAAAYIGNCYIYSEIM